MTTAELEQLRAALAEAVELLRPFADIADRIDALSACPISETGETVDENQHTSQWPPYLPVTCRIGECIAALTFVEKHGKNRSGE